MVRSSLLKSAALVSSTLLASLAAANTGQETVKMAHPSGATAEIALVGATVISFTTAAHPDRDVLFMSKKSQVDGSNAIQGGIPIVFPNLDSSMGFKVPDRGFARTTKWSVVSEQPSTERDEDSVATFRMESSDATRPMWPFEFELEYEVRLSSDSIQTKLIVHNTDSKHIEFDVVLDNYIRTNDILKDSVKIAGLQNVDYFDRVTKSTQNDTRESFTITKGVDSIYKDVFKDVMAYIRGDTYDQIVSVHFSALVFGGGHKPDYFQTDCVIRNPGQMSAEAMEDFGDDEYRYTVAIGPGIVSEKQVIAPGFGYELSQLITVLEAGIE
uniref:glucose-6-phosphate 1-epimerase n=1 Tax=Peronospora matthiolae TaxID=2874970 RepID=A0AAV1UV54_9STRA